MGLAITSRSTMVMEDTENMTPWFFVANTVFVSIAMVLWYLVIWLEDNKEIDNTNIVIFDSNKFQVKEQDDTNIKRDTDCEGVKEQGVTSDKKCDPRTYEDDNCFQQTISEKDRMDANIQDDYKQLAIDTEQAAIETTKTAIDTEQTAIDTERTALDTDQNASDTAQTAIDTEQAALDTEQTAIDTEHVSIENEQTAMKTEQTANKITEQSTSTNCAHLEKAVLSPNSQIIKTGENLSLGATFQWPRHENTVELLRSGQHQNKGGVSQNLLDKLQSLGIMRDSSDQSTAKTDSTVPLSDCARLSGKLLGRKVRICWDNFLAKSRPGLETDSPRQRKSPNKRKQKSVKSVKGWRAASSFVEIVKQDKCDESFSAALSL